MDPFEEFEFRPMTRGLGFHKKSSDLKKDVQNALNKEVPATSLDLPLEVPDSLLGEMKPENKEPKTQKEAYADLMKALESPIESEKQKTPVHELEMTQPLPTVSDPSIRIENELNPSPEVHPPHMPPMSDMPDILETPMVPEPTFEEKKQELERKAQRRGATNDPKPKLLTPAPMSFSASIIDSLFVLALSLIFLVSLLMVTGVELSSVLFSTQSDITTQVSMGVLFLAVMQMYVIVSRTFFGRTLGEWTFDLQMGSDDEHTSSVYPLKVLFRCLVNVAFGVILLPLLSFVFQVDLLAKISGLQLYKNQGS